MGAALVLRSHGHLLLNWQLESIVSPLLGAPAPRINLGWRCKPLPSRKDEKTLKPLSSLGQRASSARKCPPGAHKRSFRVNSVSSHRRCYLVGAADLDVELSLPLGQTQA